MVLQPYAKDIHVNLTELMGIYEMRRSNLNSPFFVAKFEITYIFFANKKK